MVTNSMDLINGMPGVVPDPYPPAVIPLTAFEQDCLPAVVTVESPKLTEFPFEEIVINSIVGRSDPSVITPLVGDEKEDTYQDPTDKSPKSREFPMVAISTYSIIFTSNDGEGTNPEAKIPLVLEDNPPPVILLLARVKSPKSMELPSEGIVTYSMLFMSDGVVPPANKPRVREEQEAFCAIVVDKYPKLFAFPFVDILKKSILLLFAGFSPPATTARPQLDGLF